MIQVGERAYFLHNLRDGYVLLYFGDGYEEGEAPNAWLFRSSSSALRESPRRR